MKNKTCGECKHFVQSEYLDVCTVFSEVYKPDSSGEKCDYFGPKITTNGDRIRQMSNEELAKLIVPKVIFCNGCPVKCAEKDIPQIKSNPFGADVVEDVCTKRVEAWLNAPAESEGENE